jgi:hypothetical protein
VRSLEAYVFIACAPRLSAPIRRYGSSRPARATHDKEELHILGLRFRRRHTLVAGMALCTTVSVCSPATGRSAQGAPHACISS